ncbi:unnamed protein product [Pseudo-nitzschia multistriata]|uniref:RING-type E3 ubiquitin transferase n=1 Tax=Pseudo-nitzschia multistriata TaxID=183589 RepID=A0A448Z293_9STRA|nr:unnamed protein product [Pseudo-nitzschia multistriata]
MIHRLRLRRSVPFHYGYACALVLACFASPVVATISFLDSGKTFHSRMDPHIGQPLMRGYEYVGRLQYISENPTLCPGNDNDGNGNDQTFDIVTPMDGLPVALVAQAGGCSIMEKARVASTMIRPANNVQYLIIQNSSKRGAPTVLANSNQYGDEASHDSKQSQIFPGSRYYGGSSMESLLQSLTGNEDYYDGDESFYLDFSAMDLDQPHGRVLTHLTDMSEQSSWGHDGAINLAVMYVTFAVGDELFRAVENESARDRRRGGTRILMNSKESDVSARTVIVWMLISFSVCACICCCLLACIQTSFEEEEDQEAPRRPVRRRLTLEEVRARFPSFHFNPEEHNQNNNPSHACTNDETEGSTAEDVQPKCGGYMQLSDECTICLDEFVPGVRVRELPCGHVFHSTCIARWLIERSAVCPLCKLDLYVEPEEDEDSDGNNNGDSDDPGGESPPGEGFASFFSSWWWGSRTINSEGDISLENPVDGAPAANNTGEETTTAPSQDQPLGAFVEGDTDSGATSEEGESRSWWPFSVETAPHTEEEEERLGNNRRRRPRSPGLPSAAGVLRWTMGVFGRRRQHEQQLPSQESTDDGNMVTELTEPLVPRGSLEEV